MTDSNKTPSILDRAGHDDGMTVPEGYFEQFAARMKESLPEQPWEKVSADNDETHVMPSRSLWQKVRPHVYMAAMFAGIWLMLNVSTLVGTGGDLPVASPDSGPTIAALVQDGASVYDDYAVDNFDRADLYDDLYASGFDPMSLTY